jgi:serpin B
MILVKKIQFFMFGILFLSSLSHAAQSSGNGNDFSIRLFRSILSSGAAKNVVISPFAIRAALGMAASGGKGKTQKQLGRAPDYVPKKESSSRILLANRLWVQTGFPLVETYVESMDKNFGTRPWIVDFTKAPDFLSDRVNNWVAEKTLGKINQLITPDLIESSTRMILSSALAFKSTWGAPFDRANTKEDLFSTDSSHEKKTQFVHRTGFFQYSKVQDLQILELPYSDGEFCMTLFLPKSGGGLASLEQGLRSENIERWIADLSLKEVSVSLPRFEFEADFEISENLKASGIVDPFDPELADFSGMTGKKELYLGRVFHKTTIALTEEGTDAVAGGTSVAPSRAIASAPIPFKADHPFLFIIRNRISNSIFLMGHVKSPTL